MTDAITVGAPGWQHAHLELYLRTDGAEGHLVDFTPVGGPLETPCLILQTTGHVSGRTISVPLIYGVDGGNFVIVASKGGAPEHPAWFLNLQASPEVWFQVVDKKYRGTARIAEGEERARLFAMMAAVYPPYIEYQTRTERQIPVVWLEPVEAVDHLTL
jgi:deazaflavin-dependent oxidoreductase (nitroreductase family)